MLSDNEVELLRSRAKNEFSDYFEFAGGKNYRYFHMKRVHLCAKKLMKSDEVSELDFDEKVVEAAALLHDIGRVKDIEEGYMDPFEGRDSHDVRGAEMVSEFVSDVLTRQQLQKVEKVIRNHHSEAETVEGKILQDCDELHKFGVHDLWRMIHYSAEEQRTMQQTFEYFDAEASHDLEEMLNDFYFEISREVGEKRLRKEKDAINQMKQEICGEDI